MMKRAEFTAGSLSLNLIDTVSKRSVEDVELLRGVEDLDAWLAAAGFDQGVSTSEKDLADIRALREAAFEVLSCWIDGTPFPRNAIGLLNSWASRADFRPQYREGGVKMVSAKPVEAMLSTIAADALLLLNDDQRQRLRRCPDCQMLFLDASRPGKRVWCSSSSGCGNRAKVRRHRARLKKENR